MHLGVGLDLTATRPVGPAPGAVTRYVKPAATGTGDGTSWADAAGPADIPTLATEANLILLSNADGDYTALSVTLESGGSSGNPLVIRGANPADDTAPAANALPTFVSDRDAWTKPGTRTLTDVSLFASSGSGHGLVLNASHITVSHIGFERLDTCVYVTAAASGITVQNCEAYNVRRLFDHGALVSLTSPVIRDCNVTGFSKHCVRAINATDGLLVEDCVFDSGWQDGDNFALGVLADNTANNTICRRVTVRNCEYTKQTYWQGDGFTANDGVVNFTTEDCVVEDCADAGFDMKATNWVSLRDASTRNPRAFRIWGGATVTDSVVTNLVKLGGNTSLACIWLDESTFKTSSATFTGGTWSVDDATAQIVTALVETVGKSSTLTIDALDPPTVTHSATDPLLVSEGCTYSAPVGWP